MTKKDTRMRRARRVRAKIRELKIPRLCVHKTPRHIYAQIITSNGSRVVASASTLNKSILGENNYSGNISAALIVGRIVAEKAKAAGIVKVAFDRSGFKYHGRIKALADAARESGLEF